MRSRTDFPKRYKRLFSVLLAVAFAISTPALATAQDGYVTLKGNSQLLKYNPASPGDVSTVILAKVQALSIIPATVPKQ